MIVYWILKKKKTCELASEIAYWIKALASEPGDLNLISRTLPVETEDRPIPVLKHAWILHPTHPHTNVILRKN